VSATKKPYIFHKRALYIPQKSPNILPKGPIHTYIEKSNRTYSCVSHEQALCNPQKSPIYSAKDPYTIHQRALYSYMHTKKPQNLFICAAQKSPTNSAQESYTRAAKEPCDYLHVKEPQKSFMRKSQKNHTHSAKKHYVDIHVDIHVKKLPNTSVCNLQKSPINPAKEPYKSCKRAL